MRARLAAERGFTMVSVITVMSVIGLLALGAWSAARGDITISRDDQDRKRAYEAAKAGVEWYAFQLDRDPSYWTQCASVPAVAPGVPAPVNLEWSGTGTDPRVWRTLGTAGERYTIEILGRRNAAGQLASQCSTTNASGTALQDNVLRIRVTGRARNRTRSIVATFKRRGFVDYVYFTHSEAQDPLIGGGTSAVCSSQRINRGTSCTEISFGGSDEVKGPLHTNDSSVRVISSSVRFGRPGRNDVFEVAGPSPGWVGSAAPQFEGPRVTPAPTLTPPPGNGLLKTLATPGGWVYTGQTCLVLRGDVVDVYNGTSNWASTGLVGCSGTPVTRPLSGPSGPPNGVIYVANSTSVACSGTYTRFQRYQNSTSCGDVAVSGTYSTSLTIASENDLIVNGDTRKAADSDALLGLVANNFVRVYHPIAGITSSGCGSTNNYPPGFTTVKRIDAAILALTHSFMVDNWACGPGAGTLTVNGAIAQWYRGVVGTSGGTGYLKDYNYDDRLRIREPPNLLDPLQTSWRIVRQTEQVPATG
jgi:Tfp pilus assembly protein PilX